MILLQVRRVDSGGAGGLFPKRVSLLRSKFSIYSFILSFITEETVGSLYKSFKVFTSLLLKAFLATLFCCFTVRLSNVKPSEDTVGSCCTKGCDCGGIDSC